MGGETCCCCALPVGCKWVAGYEFVIAALSLTGAVFKIVSEGFSGMVVGQIAVALIILFVAIVLIRGLKQRSRSMLSTWLIVNLIRLLLQVAMLIYIIYVFATLNQGIAELHEDHDLDDNTRGQLSSTQSVINTTFIVLIVAILTEIFLELLCLNTIRRYRIVLEREEGLGLPRNGEAVVVGYVAPPTYDSGDKYYEKA